MPNEILPENKTVETLLATGCAVGDPKIVHGGTPFAVVPKDYKIESLAALLPPAWIAQKVAFEDATSFCEYVNLFKTWRTRIFAKVTDQGCWMEAVIDYHEQKEERVEQSKPGRAAHRAMLTLDSTAEWETWMTRDRQKMTQAQFALFLEEHERLFTSPPGAELRELVLTLEGHSNARVNSALRLQSGAIKFSYEEDVELRGGTAERPGEMEVPGLLICGIAPFEYMAPYKVEARLRYRIENRALSFWYETITPHLIIRDAAKTALANVEEATKIKVLLGALQ